MKNRGIRQIIMEEFDKMDQEVACDDLDIMDSEENRAILRDRIVKRIDTEGIEQEAGPVSIDKQPGLPSCHFPTCHDDAAYEGWARKIDPFTGKMTGMNLFIAVCEGHKGVLIGAQKGESDGTASLEDR